MQALGRIVGLRRGFASSGAASTEPGFLLAEQMRRLARMPRPVPEPLRTLLPMVQASSARTWSHYKPDLTTVSTLEEAKNALSQHTNQDPASIMRLLRIATRPTLDAGMLQQVARNLFAEALKEMREEAESEAMTAAERENGREIDEVAVTDLQIKDNLLLDGTAFASGGGPSASSETGLADHIHCSGVLKKRRRKMRRHKHKKRLRKNRYKNKK